MNRATTGDFINLRGTAVTDRAVRSGCVALRLLLLIASLTFAPAVAFAAPVQPSARVTRWVNVRQRQAPMRP